MTSTNRSQTAAKNTTLEAMPGLAVWNEFFAESTRFVADRLKQDLKCQEELLRCRNAEDLLRIQTDFYRTAVEQYTAEAARFAELMTGAATQSARQFNKSHQRSYDDIPL